MVYSVFEIAYLNETTLTLLFHPNGEAVCTLNYTKENGHDLSKVKQFNLREAFGKGHLLSCQKYKGKGWTSEWSLFVKNFIELFLQIYH